jgi:hypothetical protein
VIEPFPVVVFAGIGRRRCGFLQISFAIPSNPMTVVRTVSPISRRTPETLFRPKRMFGI